MKLKYACLVATLLVQPLFADDATQCQPLVDDYKVVYSSAEALAPMNQYQTWENFYGTLEDPTSCVWPDVSDAITTASKKLIQLRSSAGPMPAMHVYTCHDIGRDLKCQGLYADDTAHILEFEYEPIHAAAAEKLSFVTLDDYHPAYKKIYWVETAHIHEDKKAYKRARLGQDETVQVPDSPGAEPLLLVAIVKDKSETLYKKYIWVIENP